MIDNLSRDISRTTTRNHQSDEEKPEKMSHFQNPLSFRCLGYQNVFNALRELNIEFRLGWEAVERTKGEKTSGNYIDSFLRTLALSQPGGGRRGQIIPPPDFQTFLRPCRTCWERRGERIPWQIILILLSITQTQSQPGGEGWGTDHVPTGFADLPTALQTLLREERRKNLGKLFWFFSKSL